MAMKVMYRDSPVDGWTTINHNFATEDAAVKHARLLRELEARNKLFETVVWDVTAGKQMPLTDRDDRDRDRGRRDYVLEGQTMLVRQKGSH
jgi:hypothetical protein